jgi:hypothetical protein
MDNFSIGEQHQRQTHNSNKTVNLIDDKSLCHPFTLSPFHFSPVRGLLLISLLFCLALLAACRLDMRDQPRYEPYEESSFFADRSVMRAAAAGTVARGQLFVDSHLYTGEIHGKLAETFPFTVTQQLLEQGQERYDIFCTPCHGLVGDGEGIVTEYGMRKPTSFHDPDLRDQPVGYYFLLISEGTRVMPGYATRIPPEDRWAIVAYIRALQLSQHADVTQLPADELPKLEQTDVITQ